MLLKKPFWPKAHHVNNVLLFRSIVRIIYAAWGYGWTRVGLRKRRITDYDFSIIVTQHAECFLGNLPK